MRLQTDERPHLVPFHLPWWFKPLFSHHILDSSSTLFLLPAVALDVSILLNVCISGSISFMLVLYSSIACFCPHVNLLPTRSSCLRMSVTDSVRHAIQEQKVVNHLTGAAD